MGNLMNEALIYVRRVTEVLSAESFKLEEFFRTMRDFDNGIIDPVSVSSSVKTLFEGHNDLIDGFKKFLPQNYGIADRIASSMAPPPSSAAGRIDANEAGSNSSREERRKRPRFSGNSEKLVTSIKFLNDLRKRLANDQTYRKFVEALDEYGSHKDIDILDQHVSTLFRNNPEFYLSFTEQVADIYEAKFEEAEEMAKKQKTEARKFDVSV